MSSRRTIYPIDDVLSLMIDEDYSSIQNTISLTAHVVRTNKSKEFRLRDKSDLYRLEFINKKRRYAYFGDWITPGHYVTCKINDTELGNELTDPERVSDIQIHITLNDKLIKVFNYSLPRIEERI